MLQGTGHLTTVGFVLCILIVYCSVVSSQPGNSTLTATATSSASDSSSISVSKSHTKTISMTRTSTPTTSFSNSITPTSSPTKATSSTPTLSKSSTSSISSLPPPQNPKQAPYQTVNPRPPVVHQALQPLHLSLLPLPQLPLSLPLLPSPSLLPILLRTLPLYQTVLSAFFHLIPPRPVFLFQNRVLNQGWYHDPLPRVAPRHHQGQ